MNKTFLTLFLILFSNIKILSQGCSMCRCIVESDANSGGTGISSSINSVIVYLFTSTYILIFIIGIFWYIRSKKTIANEYEKEKILSRVSSIHK